MKSIIILIIALSLHIKVFSQKVIITKQENYTVVLWNLVYIIDLNTFEVLVSEGYEFEDIAISSNEESAVIRLEDRITYQQVKFPSLEFVKMRPSIEDFPEAHYFLQDYSQLIWADETLIQYYLDENIEYYRLVDSTSCY